MIAPVSVARSISRPAPSAADQASPSASMRRPSASVLFTSTVLPFMILMVSPGFTDRPEHLALQAVYRGRELDGVLGECGRRELVAREILEVARDVLRLRDDRGLGDRAGRVLRRR